MGVVSKGLKNEFETAKVNEPSVFEPLKFFCISIKRLIISFKRYNKSIKQHKIEWNWNKQTKMEIKSRKKKNANRIETSNMSFKQLIVFPLQYLAN